MHFVFQETRPLIKALLLCQQKNILYSNPTFVEKTV